MRCCHGRQNCQGWYGYAYRLAPCANTRKKLDINGMGRGHARPHTCTSAHIMRFPFFPCSFASVLPLSLVASNRLFFTRLDGFADNWDCVVLYERNYALTGSGKLGRSAHHTLGRRIHCGRRTTGWNAGETPGCHKFTEHTVRDKAAHWKEIRRS